MLFHSGNSITRSKPVSSCGRIVQEVAKDFKAVKIVASANSDAAALKDKKVRFQAVLQNPSFF